MIIKRVYDNKGRMQICRSEKELQKCIASGMSETKPTKEQVKAAFDAERLKEKQKREALLNSDTAKLRSEFITAGDKDRFILGGKVYQKTEKGKVLLHTNIKSYHTLYKQELKAKGKETVEENQAKKEK